MKKIFCDYCGGEVDQSKELVIGGTDGVVGLRINHGVNVHVADVSIEM